MMGFYFMKIAYFTYDDEKLFEVKVDKLESIDDGYVITDVPQIEDEKKESDKKSKLGFKDRLKKKSAVEDDEIMYKIEEELEKIDNMEQSEAEEIIQSSTEGSAEEIVESKPKSSTKSKNKKSNKKVNKRKAKKQRGKGGK